MSPIDDGEISFLKRNFDLTPNELRKLFPKKKRFELKKSSRSLLSKYPNEEN